MVEISQNLVAFSEYMNFTHLKKTLEEKEKTSFQLQPIFPPNKNEIIIVRHRQNEIK